uniref:tetraspanin-17-like n=1 Tax=Ciona intestinalis TaxID=7719 RepID=UPI00089DCC0E
MEWYKRHYLKPSCCHLFIKHVLCAINIIFLIVGLCLVGLGLWGFISLLTSSNPKTWKLFIFDPMFIVLIVGVIMTFVTSLAIVGIMKDSVWVIKCYITMLIILCILFIAGGIAFWILRPQVSQFTTTSLSSIFNNEYHYDITGRPGCMESMTSWIKNNTPLLVGVWAGLIVGFFIFQFVAVHFHIREITFHRALREKIASYEAGDGDITDTSLSSSESEDEDD